jgi:hypothetical protein
MKKLLDLNRFIQPLALVAASLLIVGSGCDGCGADKEGDFQQTEPPKLVTQPLDLIQFAAVQLGATDSQSLKITNTGEGDLRITKIRLVEETIGDEGGEEFTRGTDWVGSATMKTDEFFFLKVDYNPRDTSPDTGYVEITCNDPELEGGIKRIDLRTPDLEPRIYSKENIIFRRVPPVSEDTRNKFFQLSHVQNIGQATLKISDVQLSNPDSPFSISYPTGDETDPESDGDAWPTSLEPDESFPIRVYFNPLDDRPTEDEKIIFYSNDPGASEYVVNLVGNSGAPCLLLTPEDEINFGEAGIGNANNKTITVQNCSPTNELKISSIELTDDGGGVFEIKDGTLPADLPDAEAVLEADGADSFVLSFTPTDESPSQGELTVESDDPAKSTLVVPVVGKGTNNQCPQAVAEARLSGTQNYRTEINTIPLKTIDFRGSNSVDPDGSIARYEWSIIARPTNSTARLQPSANVPDPKLFLDLAGVYEIELNVFDDQGTRDCSDPQAKVTILATPDEDIHIQLVWDTPSDDDGTNTNGTDVDLHYLHPLGNWNALPYDIHWRNITYDWGATGPDDDPSLDIDDTDGAGPENINHNNPESGFTYAVGVYYYADNGFGPSYATVRIFIQGTQQFEYRDMYLPATAHFWKVAVIQVPSYDILAQNELFTGFP